jgi:adhesin/invasin
MPTLRFAHRAVLIAGATLALPGCKKALPVVPVLPDALTVVQGNAQSAQAGRELPTALVLRVTDKSGLGLAEVSVSLAIGQGGGTVSPASATTDANGEVKAKWTLGPREVVQTLLASVPGVAPVTIHATGLLPADIIIAQGNNQTAKVGLALQNAIVIRVLAAGNVALAGVPVAFQVVAGGGAFSPQSILTNSLGEATVKWTLGLQPGANVAIVTVSTLSPVTMSATATP